MAEPNRPPDNVFSLTTQEVAQAIANFLVSKGRLVPDGRHSEATTLIIGEPGTFKLWLAPKEAERV